MRIWDLPPKKLCRNHLLGEHRELHALWSILTRGKKGYANHPETRRWAGKLRALYLRHEELVKEMRQRGFRHQSPLDISLATGKKKQEVLLESREQQRIILRRKNCGCRV